MEESIATIMGLVGVVLMISVGKWLSNLREWLLGFSVRINPLRILGDVLSCLDTITVGFLVGFFWGIYQADSWPQVIVFGGIIGLASYMADELLALVDAGVRKLVCFNPPPPMPVEVPEKKEEKTPAPMEPRPLSEDEAHATVGAHETIRE